MALADRDRDVAESKLCHWKQELTATPALPSLGNGLSQADLAEIADLKKEVSRLSAQRNFPKNAATFFARRRYEIRLPQCPRGAKRRHIRPVSWLRTCLRFRVRAFTPSSTA